MKHSIYKFHNKMCILVQPERKLRLEMKDSAHKFQEIKAVPE